MSLVNRQLPALFNGTSQQPATLRLPSQAEEQINAHGTVVDGLRKRPPFQNIEKLVPGNVNGAFLHAINRDTTERYLVVITAGRVRVFDALDGSEQTVNVPGREFESLVQSTGREDGAGVSAWSDGPLGKTNLAIAVVTTGINGDTVVLQSDNNPEFSSPATRATITTNGSTVVSGLPQGFYYRVVHTVNGSGTVDANLRWNDTSYIFNDAPATKFAIVSVADYSFIVNKDRVVKAKVPKTTQPFNFTGQYAPRFWGYANLTPQHNWWTTFGTNTLDGTVQTFTDLPNPDNEAPDPIPREGDYYKVSGANEDNFGSYYVRFTGGVWEETYGPSANTGIDEYSMPHALVRESDGTFTVTTFKWKVRQYGDDDTNPDPTFVGRKINDVFYYKNRLGLVSDENVVFSGVNDFGNFYRNTVVDLLDSDVVDVAVSSSKVSVLKFAVPFNSGLMLFSDQTQFSLNVDQLLTPTSVSIDTVTEYQVNPNVRPVGIGSDVYFVSEAGEFSHLREYFVREDASQTDATNITAHVPRFVPKGITRLAGSSNSEVLFAISNEVGFKNRIYVYKFFWNGDEKVQSSWSYWELDANDEIQSIDVLDQDLFAVITRADGTFLEKVDLESGATTGSLSFDILLDRRKTLPAGSFGGGVTTYDLPYALTTQREKDALQVIRTDTPGTHAGKRVIDTDILFVDDDTITLDGDTTNNTYVYGLKYDMSYTLSQQFVMNGEQAVTTGRLMLRTITLFFTDTAFFTTEVDPYGAGFNQVEEIVPSQLADFTGKTIGEASLVTGQPIYHTGTYSFQVHGDSKHALIKLKNDTHVQCKFQQIEWEGFYFNRARNI